MKILAVDIGTGTQDILLIDPRLDIENAFKLILPSPTMIVRSRIQSATRRGKAILLTGVMMGGGPCAWAAEDHIRAGYKVFATPGAAQTFNDDLAAVASSGVQIIGEDEANGLSGDIQPIQLCDFDYPAIQRALSEFGIDLANDPPAALAVAVFDHGAAPPQISDRQFRFDYLDQRIRSTNNLSAFAFPSAKIPPEMTRLQAVAHSAREIDAPLIVMDTAPAAILGALYDPFSRDLTVNGPFIVCNIGNFHTIAFRLGLSGIEAVLEHHTGLIDQPKLEGLLHKMASGTLTHAEVFDDHGHGALMYTPQTVPIAGRLVVTGPRRGMLAGSPLQPHFAVPFGDMMVAGCFGLLSAAADHLPAIAGPLRATLNRRQSSDRAPWEI